MAKYAGKGGTIYIATTELGEVDNWTYSEQAAIVEDYSMGDASMSQHSTAKSGSAQLVCFWDPDDTALDALTVGSTVTLKLCPEGNSATDEILSSATAEVSSYQIDNPKDGYVKVTIGTIGVLAWSVVGA